jgi:predicted ATPase
MAWRIQLFGGLSVSNGDTVITRFESRKVAALLAYLALHPNHAHPREELIELVWPDVDPEAGRHRLRQGLSTLRKQLEPPGSLPGSVLVADRQTVRLAPGSFTTDVTDFDRLVRARRYAEARALYKGEMLPGYYEEWILDERYRLEAILEDLPDDDVATFQETKPSVSQEAKAPTQTSGSVLLPTYLNSFVGRENEAAHLQQLLATSRLVTITGMGGGGKTRLSVETARAVSDNLEVVVFVPLADCSAPEAIADHVRASLQIPASTVPAIDQIKHVLGGKHALIVFDNFEQVVEPGGARVVEHLLASLPQLKCLVSSRKLLGIEGEREFPLAPLATPSADVALEAAASSPSVSLFIHRAQDARPGFQITERNREDIIALCQALDGMPLAIELAASRIRAMSPAEMRAGLDSRLTWLVRSGPSGEKLPRHRSLSAAMEWSWQLLSPAQQQFLTQLSVFRGGCSVQLAEQVCQEPKARERLESLVTDSFLRSDELSDGSTRFRMLETVHSFVATKLPAEAGPDLRARHRTALLHLVNRSPITNSALEVEAGNLLAALESAILDQDCDSAFDIAVALDDRWLTVCSAQTAVGLMKQAIQLDGGERRKRIETLDLVGNMALLAGDTATSEWAVSESKSLAASDSPEQAIALIAEARDRIMRFMQTEATTQQLEQAVELAHRLGEKRIEATAMRLLGLMANRKQELKHAQVYLTRSLELYREIGDIKSQTYSLDNLANTYLSLGNFDESLKRYHDCRRNAEAVGDVVYQAKVYQNLGTVYARQKRWQDALDADLESIRRNHALGNARILGYSFWNLPEPLVYLGQPELAAQMMSFAERFWTSTYGPLPDDDKGYMEDIYAHASQLLRPNQMAAARELGASLSLNEAVRIALQ